jgi:non-specific serine/threonine protein kinase
LPRVKKRRWSLRNSGTTLFPRVSFTPFSAGAGCPRPTDVKETVVVVREFQEDESIAFFVLSLKAGGFGLNLTAASHVIHFDRWWNPAVENQATDRAFRIGQTKNVLVQKFICRGTVEEKIDALLESKQKMSEDVLESGADLLLTEMNNDELLKLVALDIHAAQLE